MKKLISIKKIFITLLILFCLIVAGVLFISSHTYLKLYSNENLINMLETKNDWQQTNLLILEASIGVYNDKSYTPFLIKALRTHIFNSLILSRGESGEIANQVLNSLYNENKFYYNGTNSTYYHMNWRNRTIKEIYKMSDEEQDKEAQEESERTIIFWENAYKNGLLK